jgi:hypothetical protein
MNKINSELGIDSGVISLDALKSAEKGDMVIFVRETGVQLLTVTSKVATRGRKGGTSLVLADFHGGAEIALPSTSALPEGVSMVRKVLKGVNVRTMRKVQAALDAEPLPPVADVIPEAAPEVVLEAASEAVADEVAQCAFFDDMSETDRLIAEIVAEGL